MIRFATMEDIPAIRRFLDAEWKKDHIMARDEDFFRFQAVSEETGADGALSEQCHFVLAIDADGAIEGILGYIPYGRNYRTHPAGQGQQESRGCDLLLAMWKCLNRSGPATGMELMTFLKEETGARLIACNGVAKKVLPLYRFLGYETGEMRHFYRLREKPLGEAYRIAKIYDRTVPEIEADGKDVRLVRFGDFAAMREKFDWTTYQTSNRMPYKELWFIEKRYFRHPQFQYLVYGECKEETICRTALIFRLQEYDGAYALRLMDVIGDIEGIQRAAAGIDRILEETKAEYADTYTTGVDDAVWKAAGWKDVKETDNIIPEHFDPYECQNIDIFYATNHPDITLFKADGDQDRPN